MPKKKTALTIEERLQQALVSAEEQPYELPENWVWTYGKFLFKPMETNKPQGEFFYYIDIDAIDNKRQAVTKAKKINSKNAPSRASRKLHKGDTIFSLVRPYLRNIAYIDASLAECIASTGFYVCTPVAVLESKFLYQLMISSYVVDGLNKHMKGDNSPSIRKDDIENYPFPLPPLAEQQRIVDRIEELFAKLDEAKEKLQEVIDSFAVRKAAILHRAFTGELTQKWRKENGVEFSSWEETNWGSFIRKIEAGKNWSALGRPPEDNEFGVVKVSAVTWGEFMENESKTCIIESQWNEKTRIDVGDFLFSRANTIQLVGNCVIVRDISKRLMLSDKILRLSFDKSVFDKFILWYTRTVSYRKQVEVIASGNQDGMRNISQGNMRLIKFPLPTLPEQHEIVRLIDKLLAQERKAQQAAEQALASIELMKKAILAKAFRGELGTNKASEASAVELLRQVLAEEG